MGEPSGISSEIIIKVWLKRNLYKIPPFILVDDLKKLNQAKRFFNLKANFQLVTKDDDINKIFSRNQKTLPNFLDLRYSFLQYQKQDRDLEKPLEKADHQ